MKVLYFLTGFLVAAISTEIYVSNVLWAQHNSNLELQAFNACYFGIKPSNEHEASQAKLECSRYSGEIYRVLSGDQAETDNDGADVIISERI